MKDDFQRLIMWVIAGIVACVVIVEAIKVVITAILTLLGVLGLVAIALLAVQGLLYTLAKKRAADDCRRYHQINFAAEGVKKEIDFCQARAESLRHSRLPGFITEPFAQLQEVRIATLQTLYATLFENEQKEEPIERIRKKFARMERLQHAMQEVCNRPMNETLRAITEQWFREEYDRIMMEDL